MSTSRTVGVLGGMGPAATADFFLKLVRFDPAKKDSEHLHVIIDCDPRIPDRTEAVLGTGPSPVPALLQAARNLQKAGAELIAIPCITAHAFLEDVQEGIDIPIISALAETAAAVARDFPAGASLAVLSTSGTLRMKLFQKTLPERELIFPDARQQEEIVMQAIYGPQGVKAVGVNEGTRRGVCELVEELGRRSAAGVIAGCTEFSVMFSDFDPPLPLVDPMRILAQAVVRESRI